MSSVMQAIVVGLIVGTGMFGLWCVAVARLRVGLEARRNVAAARRVRDFLEKTRKADVSTDRAAASYQIDKDVEELARAWEQYRSEMDAAVARAEDEVRRRWRREA